MTQLSSAENLMIQQVQAGDSGAWEQLVRKFQGRLLAFAKLKMPRGGEAEDVVQETFLSFVKSVTKFKGESSLETYLFTILRRRIVDFYRGKKLPVCQLSEDNGESSSRGHAIDRFEGDWETASVYARRDETLESKSEVLMVALRELVSGYKKKLNFRDLQVVELVFYAQLKNKKIAELLEIDEKHIGMLKHRFLKKLKVAMGEADTGNIDEEEGWLEGEDLLTTVWEDMRLSCPKHSTIGKYFLGSLDADWEDYLKFHIHEMGCHYCAASLEDIKSGAEKAQENVRAHDKIMRSTIGFMNG